MLKRRFSAGLSVFGLTSCQIFETVSWTATSGDEMRYSHLRTEQFYGGMKLCRIPDENQQTTGNATRLVDPVADVIELKFSPVPVISLFESLF